MIKGELGLAKSTLSNWLTRIPFTPSQEVIERVGRAKLKSALYKHRQKWDDINRMRLEARRDVGLLSSRDLFMLGIGLYLGEGSKALEEIRVVNSDPLIMKLAIRWLKKFCHLKQRHFKIAVHCYPDNDISKAVNFWSRETRVPVAQFGKTMIDMRQNKSILKKSKLPYGTAHLYVRSGGTLSPGVKSLHRKIMGWIETSTKQI
ncbi:MAG: hypothetical protein HYS57_03055 [Parcubacteria group bacterium]|nr:hypothetical protein [Parcubacteria group bacterium]